MTTPTPQPAAESTKASPAPQNRSSALMVMAAIVVVMYGMQMAKNLIVPFLIAVFLALISIKPVLWMQRHKVPPIVAALLVVTVLLLILATAGMILGTTIADFTAQLPVYQARLDVIVDSVFRLLVKHLNADESVQSLSDMIDPGWAMGLVATLFNSLRTVMTNMFLIVFTIIFILLEASSIQTKLLAAFGRNGRSLDGPRKFLQNLGRYLGIKTLISLATGICAGALTWLLGLDFPLLWAMLAFLLNYVPTIGSIIAAVPAVLLALIQIGPGAAGATAVGFIVINIIFGNFLEPRIMGYGVGLSPLIVFVGLFVWGWIFGPVGMLLSVPLSMTLKLALESDDRTRWVAVLIGSERDADYAIQRRRAARNKAAQATPASS